MSEATQHQENVTSEQASAVNEVTSTIVELNTSSKQVCEKAEQASKSSQGVLKIASDGQKAVEKSMGEVNTIQSKVRTISGQALNLSLEAQQIGSIVKSVSEIANKTDMLAINAGIEAARAGENGKGFSIGASEVRNLADQSKKSAEKIAMLIESIQSATNSTVLATEDAIKSVQVGIKFIVEVGQSIDQLIKNTQEAVNYASEIVLASKQQSLGTDQVSSVMSNINEGMRTTAVSAVQILEEAKTLKKMSSDLSDVASKYKI
jgi:methyl-accepting chemotaxis protein